MVKLKYGPYSPSRLDTAVCGYAFKKQYIEHDPQAKKENLPQARGSAVHEIYETITKKIIDCPSYVFSGDEVRQWVVDAINRHPAAYMETEAILEMAKLYIRKPPATLVSDAEVELKLAVKWVITEAGTKFETCDYDDPQAFVRGKADILMISDDTTYAMVYDHKTQPNIEDADTFQLGVYSWLIWKRYPFLQEVRTVLHFARYGIYSQPYVWTQEQMLQIEEELITRVTIVENRTSWDAVPHSKCQYCNLMMECPAVREFFNVSEDGRIQVKAENLAILGNTGKAVKVAGMINIFEEMLKKAKSSLREYVKESGMAIAIPGKVYDFYSDTSIDWDKVNKSAEIKEKAYAIFQKYGIDPKDFMGFSQTFSKPVWMLENEALVKELAETFPRKSSTEFSGKKA